MDLAYNPAPRFTEWVVARSLLRSPFVLIDVGVQGGVGVRWRHLGDQLEVHGFDPLEETIAPLQSQDLSGHRYHALALGNEDGERRLYVQSETTSSCFYPKRDQSRYGVDPRVYDNRDYRIVPIRKLDSLVTEGVIPRADFIKLDCEGFEPEALKGAAQLLARGEILGAEAESSFGHSYVLPEGSFAALQRLLAPARLMVADMAADRVPCASFKAKLPAPLPGTHRLATLNVLCLRDLVHERAYPEDFPFGKVEPPSVDQILKCAIIAELYDLRDVAHDLLTSFAPMLTDRLDPDHAATLLC